MKVLGKIYKAIQIVFQKATGTITLDPDNGQAGDITISLATDLNVDTEIITEDGTQEMQSKTFRDPAAPAKKMAFDLSTQGDGTNTIKTSGTSTTITLPDATALPGSSDTLVGRDTTDTLTNKIFDADANSLTNVDNGNIKSGANIAHNKMSPLDFNVVPVTDGAGTVTGSTITSTELDTLDGITSNIQTQMDSKVDDSRVGAAESMGIPGIASLDANGKLPSSQLTVSAMQYVGTWNASTNSPTLSDGSGNSGDLYRVSVAGTQDLGSGSISFEVGDYVILNESSVWERSDTTDAVTTVNGSAGDVTINLDSVDDQSTGPVTLDSDITMSDLKATTPELTEPTIKNKATLNGDFGAVLDLEEWTSPVYTNPPADHHRLYFNPSDKQLHVRNSSGDDKLLGAGAGGSGTGSLNYVTNPVAQFDTSDWTFTAGSGSDSFQRVDNDPTKTPYYPALTTVFKAAIVAHPFDPDSEAYHRFELSDLELNKVLNLSLGYYVSGTGASFQVKAELWEYNNPSYTGSPVRLPLSTDVSGETLLVNKFEVESSLDTTFSTSSNKYLEIKLVFSRDSGIGFSDFYFNNVFVGAESPAVSGIITDWEDVTADVSFANIPGTSEKAVHMKRVGDTAHYRGWLQFNATGSGSDIAFLLQTNLTVDTSKIHNISNRNSLGFGIWEDVSANKIEGLWARWYDDGGGKRVLFSKVDSPRDNIDGDEVVSGDKIAFEIAVPIEEWSNQTIKVGSVSSIITPWRTYTMEIDEGAITQQNVRWRRVGESMEIQGWVRKDSATGGSQAVKLSIPALDVTIDTTEIPASSTYAGAIGSGHWYDAGSVYQSLAPFPGTTTQIAFAKASQGATTNLRHTDLHTGDEVSFTLTIPITEWKNTSQNSALVGIGHATSDSVGLVKKNKWQQKFLTGDITAGTSNITDLQFTGLTPGKTYRVTYQAAISITGTSATESVNTWVQHDGNVVAQARHRNDGQSDESASAQAVVGIFKATSTTLETHFSKSGAVALFGNTSGSETFVILEELANYEETDEW